MKFELREVAIRELYNGYKDEGEVGAVVGFGGRLNIRPEFQREYVYDDGRRNAVIRSIKNGFPISNMYWFKNEAHHNIAVIMKEFELMDGQQRTISICRYVDGDFSVDGLYFHNLTKYEQEQILNYRLLIYVCEGNDKEKLDWFKTINIGGLVLTDQELRNAVYTGPWLSDAKRYFSRNNCPAEHMGKGYIKGDPKRQALLELALTWICLRDNCTIEEYMGKHQFDSNAQDLKDYFEKVINWAKDLFPKPIKNEMVGLDWGGYYHVHGKKTYDKTIIARRVLELMKDKEVTNKRGIYRYLLDDDERHLQLRTFDDDDILEAYTRQKGICPMCVKEGYKKTHYDISEMEADHIIPWAKGGKTNGDNCQMLCKRHNGMKSDH